MTIGKSFENEDDELTKCKMRNVNKKAYLLAYLLRITTVISCCCISYSSRQLRTTQLTADQYKHG